MILSFIIYNPLKNCPECENNVIVKEKIIKGDCVNSKSTGGKASINIKNDEKEEKDHVYPYKGKIMLPYLPDRSYLVDLFNFEGFTDGAEIGVAEGDFSRNLLSKFKNCNRYYLIDPWMKQKDYKDAYGNVPQNRQDGRYKKVSNMASKYKCTTVWRKKSEDAVKLIDDESLDFIYIDARHDFKSVLEDLILWYPKVKVGGIVSGHDYLDGDGLDSRHKNREWCVMNTGLLQKDGKAVKGGVDLFAQMIDTQVLLTTNEPKIFTSWYFRKFRDINVNIEMFEDEFEGLEFNDENYKKIKSIKSHLWLPTIQEMDKVSKKYNVK